MPLHYRQLNQTQAALTFGVGRAPWERAEEGDDGDQRMHGAGNLLQKLPERWELPVWVLLPLERSREAGAASPDREMGCAAWLEMQG